MQTHHTEDAAARPSQPMEVEQSDLQVAIAHEWLVRYAGSERCVHEMLRVFPEARLLTTVFEPSALPREFASARSSVLQHLPGSTRHHEWLLPLMPLAWRLRPRVADVDLVISSSHACAKGVRAASGIPHLCYCHTPMRYAWQFEAERERFPSALRPVARAGMGWFRRWDRKTAAHVTHFVANSTAVAQRVERSFGRRAEVIHPPVDTDFFTPGGERAGFFLYVGRLVGYKRPDLVVEAFAELPELELLVVGEGPMRPALTAAATQNVTFLGAVDDDRLRELYRGATALVYPAEEDFGITMAETIACGTPVIGLSEGGAADIVEPGATGRLIASQSVSELRAAVRETAHEVVDRAAIAARAQRFSAHRFRREIRAAAERCAGVRA